MRRFILATACAMALAAPLGAQTSPQEAEASDLIEYLLGELDSIRGSLPEDDAPLAFDERMNRAMDRALGRIAPDTHDRWSREVRTLEDRIATTEGLRADLLRKRMTAQSHEALSAFDRLLGREVAPGSPADIEAKLAEADATLNALRTAREAAIGGFANDLAQNHGVTLTHDQAAAALFPVNGALIVESAVTLEVLAEVERQLADLMAQGVAADIAGDYLATASITRLMHARMLSHHLDAYDGTWLPEIARMRDEAEDLMARTRAAKRAARSEDVQATYDANLAVQARIIDITRDYETMLRARRTDTARALGQANEAADAAVNTLQTLETASALTGLMAESFADYDALSQIEVPDLIPLDDAEMFEQFRDISRALEAGS